MEKFVRCAERTSGFSKLVSYFDVANLTNHYHKDILEEDQEKEQQHKIANQI